MGNVVVGHRQDGDLGDGAGAANHTTGTLVDASQIGVHVTGETTTAGHLLTGGGHLTQGIGVGRHVGQDDQHVLTAIVGQVLGGGQGQTGGHDTLNGGIVGQVQEEHGLLHGTVLLELATEETGSLLVDTHSGEDDAEILLLALLLDQTGLAHNLGGDLVMGETGTGEEGDLLAT
eukprot:130022_1